MTVRSDFQSPIPIRTDGDAHDATQVKIIDMLDPTRSAEVTANRELRTVDTLGTIMALLTSSNFLKLSNFDSIVPSVVGDTTTYSYYESSALIGTAVLRFTDPTDWDLKFNAFLNDDNGDILLDDDDSQLNLE